MTRKLPTEPGWWWIKDRRGRLMAVEVATHDGELCLITNTTSPWLGSATDDEFIEPVPTLDQLREMRAQVEFLEWMAKATCVQKISFMTIKTIFDKTHITYVENTEYKTIAEWPGQLRDGWKHWDKIKEAVR